MLRGLHHDALAAFVVCVWDLRFSFGHVNVGGIFAAYSREHTSISSNEHVLTYDHT